MRWFRFSIAQMLLTVLFCGVAVAALCSPTDLWAALWFTFSAGVLLVAPLVAAYRRGSRRAFWAGVSVVGGGYLLLTLIPDARPQLATTVALEALHARVFVSDQTGRGITFAGNGDLLVANGGWIRDVGWGNVTVVVDPHLAFFERIGHSVFSLIFALIGGVVAQRLHSKASRDAPARESPEHQARAPGGVES